MKSYQNHMKLHEHDMRSYGNPMKSYEKCCILIEFDDTRVPLARRAKLARYSTNPLFDRLVIAFYVRHEILRLYFK